MMTSFNVYAGLAGLWFIYDRAEERSGLPEGEFEVPLILQDRTFHTDGSLAYTMLAVQGADTPVVNGKAYPYLAVEPRRYRLRILNGSNERVWRLHVKVSVAEDGWLARSVHPIGIDQGVTLGRDDLDILHACAGEFRRAILGGAARVRVVFGTGGDAGDAQQFLQLFEKARLIRGDITVNLFKHVGIQIQRSVCSSGLDCG